MSEVISFRLNKENPREAEAYEILKAWYGKGHSIRHTITEALLKLEEPGTESVSGAKLDEINETLDQVRHLLTHIGNNGAPLQKGKDAGPYCSSLTDNFIASIKKAAKPGMKLD